jgi:hypothetical protein
MKIPMFHVATPLLAVVLLANASQELKAQDGVPIIKANSTIVDIQDGHNFRQGHWTIEPNPKTSVIY